MMKDLRLCGNHHAKLVSKLETKWRKYWKLLIVCVVTQRSLNCNHIPRALQNGCGYLFGVDSERNE